MKNIIILDVETTGPDYLLDEIYQMSYIVLDKDFNIIKGKNFFFMVDYIEFKFNKKKLNRDKIKMLSNNKIFKDYYNEIFDDLNGNLIVCHKCDHDISFLKSEFMRVNNKNKFIYEEFCTMKYYTNILKIPNEYYGYKYPKLTEIMPYLNIKRGDINNKSKEIFNMLDDEINLHDSRVDSVITYLVAINTPELINTYIHLLDKSNDINCETILSNNRSEALSKRSDMSYINISCESKKKYSLDKSNDMNYETILNDNKSKVLSQDLDMPYINVSCESKKKYSLDKSNDMYYEAILSDNKNEVLSQRSDIPGIKISFGDKMKYSLDNIIKDLFSVEGRMIRKKYILYSVSIIFIFYIFGSFITINDDSFRILSNIMGITLIPISIKRLRDIDNTKWLAILLIIPIINLFFIMELCCLKSDEDKLNKASKSQNKVKTETINPIIKLAKFILIGCVTTPLTVVLLLLLVILIS